MENPTKPVPRPHPDPIKQHPPERANEENKADTNNNDAEINPGKVGNNTEVDLDKSNTHTYPNNPNPLKQ